MSKWQQNNRLHKIIFFSNQLEVLGFLYNGCGSNLENTVLWETECGHTFFGWLVVFHTWGQGSIDSIWGSVIPRLQTNSSAHKLLFLGEFFIVR